MAASCGLGEQTRANDAEVQEALRLAKILPEHDPNVDIQEEVCDDLCIREATARVVRSQLPSRALAMGPVHVAGSTAGRASWGSVGLTYHGHSSAAGQGNTYDVVLHPYEFEVGAAAAQIALPGRAEQVYGRLVQFALASVVTTTTMEPPAVESIQASGAAEGGRGEGGGLGKSSGVVFFFLESRRR